MVSFSLDPARISFLCGSSLDLRGSGLHPDERCLPGMPQCTHCCVHCPARCYGRSQALDLAEHGGAAHGDQAPAAQDRGAQQRRQVPVPCQRQRPRGGRQHQARREEQGGGAPAEQQQQQQGFRVLRVLKIRITITTTSARSAAEHR